MERSELCRIVRSVPVFFGSERLTLQCDFGKLTPELLRRMCATSDWETTLRFLAELVVSWDLTEGGKPYPLTQETLLGLPAMAIQQMIAAVATSFIEQSTGTPACLRRLLEE